jgi:hypothetical protein
VPQAIASSAMASIHRKIAGGEKRRIG